MRLMMDSSNTFSGDDRESNIFSGDDREDDRDTVVCVDDEDEVTESTAETFSSPTTSTPTNELPDVSTNRTPLESAFGLQREKTGLNIPIKSEQILPDSDMRNSHPHTEHLHFYRQRFQTAGEFVVRSPSDCNVHSSGCRKSDAPHCSGFDPASAAVDNPFLRAVEGHILDQQHRMEIARYFFHVSQQYNSLGSGLLCPQIFSGSLGSWPHQIGLPPVHGGHGLFSSQHHHHAVKAVGVVPTEINNIPLTSPTNCTSTLPRYLDGETSSERLQFDAGRNSQYGCVSTKFSFNTASSSCTTVNEEPSKDDNSKSVKKYKCDICEKAFSRSNTLVTHRRIHTGEKPFSCGTCGRAFRQPGNLTRHRLTHTTLKPHVCRVCHKAFNRASNLQTHLRTHQARLGEHTLPQPPAATRGDPQQMTSLPVVTNRRHEAAAFRHPVTALVPPTYASMSFVQ